MQLRVAVFGPVKKYGGVYNHAYNLVKWLRKKGVTADYFTDPDMMPVSEELHQIDDRDHILLKIKKILKNIDYANKNYDIAHLHGTYCAFSFLFKIPVIVTMHSLADIKYEDKSVLPKNLLIDSLVLLNLKRNVKAITISKYLQELLKHHGISSEVIPNGIDDDLAKLPKKRTREPIILYVGEFNKYKNIFGLLNAYVPLREKYKLVLIGWGVLEKQMREFIARHELDNAKIIIRPTRETITEYYEKSTCFVLPSERETFGIVVLEAMSKKLPVIVHKYTGPSEIVKNNYNGLVVNTSESQQITEAIIKLMENKPLRSKLAKNGLRTVKNYLWSNISKRILNLYQNILSR